MKNTSVAEQTASGRDARREAVIAALVEGEASGISERSPEEIRAAVKKDLRLDGDV